MKRLAAVLVVVGALAGCATPRDKERERFEELMREVEEEREQDDEYAGRYEHGAKPGDVAAVSNWADCGDGCRVRLKSFFHAGDKTISRVLAFEVTYDAYRERRYTNIVIDGAGHPLMFHDESRERKNCHSTESPTCTFVEYFWTQIGRKDVERAAGGEVEMALLANDGSELAFEFPSEVAADLLKAEKQLPEHSKQMSR